MHKKCPFVQVNLPLLHFFSSVTVTFCTGEVCVITNIVVAGDYAGFPGCGLLRLHSTYRHDLKIYASDEGRVQMTAAAFAKVRSFLRAL